jgi:RHS repeat-associated protein
MLIEKPVKICRLTPSFPGTLTTRYIHGPRVDEVLAKVTSSGSTYPLEDGLGSTIAVTSPTGEVLERISYTDAHGTPTFQTATGTPLPGTTTGTRFLFTGREWLAELGLYDYRNRTYSPTLGRFLQTDPIRFDAGDVNLYRYVTNNPVRYVDPMGTNIIDTIKEWFKGPAKSPEKPMPDPTGWPEVVLPTGYTAACIAARAAYINCLKAQTWDPCNVDCSSAMAHMYRVCDAASKVNEAFQ